MELLHIKAASAIINTTSNSRELTPYIGQKKWRIPAKYFDN